MSVESRLENQQGDVAAEGNDGPHLQFEIRHGAGSDNQRILDPHMQHLLWIFPVEIWEDILEAVNDTSSLENLCNTTPFLRSMLLPRRTEFLFPRVCNIFARKYHEASRNTMVGGGEGPYEEPCQAHEDNAHKISWFTGFIKLRLVCRTWCQAVDHWYQNHDLHYKMRNDLGNIYDTLVESLVKESIQTVKAYMLTIVARRFESTHYSVAENVGTRNPFLGRAISIRILDGQGVSNLRNVQAEMYLNRLGTFLSNYGQFIWHCCLIVDDRYPIRAEWYPTLKSIMERMPNLKTLEIQYHYARRDWDSIFQEPKASCPESISHEQALPANLNVLPTFRELKFFKVTTSYLPDPYFQELLRCGSNACIMDINAYCCRYEMYNMTTATIPNLRQLSLRFHSPVDFETFFARDVSWPLYKLHLDFGMASFIKWSRIFALLQQYWGQTLTILQLDLPSAQSDTDQNILLEELETLRLNLPNVTSITLVVHNLASFDFLLLMRNVLESISVCMLVGIENEFHLGILDTVENGKEIQLLTCADRPMESNIWTLFPKVKTIKFQLLVDSDQCIWSKLPSRCYHLDGSVEWLHTREEWARWRNKQQLANL